MNCEAKTTEGKRCTFNSSAVVGGKWFCGNHAAKARSTQLMSTVDLPLTEPKGPFVGAIKRPPNGEHERRTALQLLELLEALRLMSYPREDMARALDKWKAGEL